MNWIKYHFAKFCSNRFKADINNILESDAMRWNFLQSQVLTRGKAKWDWDKYYGRKVEKCGRCLHKFKNYEVKMRDKQRKKLYCTVCWPEIIKIPVKQKEKVKKL